MAFVVCGMMFGSWASRIPAIKDRAGLDAVQLGFALLGSALGSVLAMTFAGYAAGRFGSHRMTVLLLLGCAAVLPLIASATSFVALAGALFLFGACYGSMDVCMNANGLAIERAGTTPIMSRLHASWSIGSFIGAFSTTLALQAGLSVF
jgi:predicted MFS family arabinose efflux permease